MDRILRVARWTLWALIAFAPLAHAAPIDGLWLVETKNAHVLIEVYRGARCGRIVWVRDSLDTSGKLRRDAKNPNPSQRDHGMRDLVIVSGLSPTAADSAHWRGKVYDPRNGHTYSARLDLEGKDQLKLRGYVGISLLGRTARWTRLREATAEDGKPGPAPMVRSTR